MENINKRSYLDHYIAMIIISLMAIGAVFICSASASLRSDNDLSKLVFFPAAIIVMLVSSLIPYQWFRLSDKAPLRSLSVWMMLFSVAALCIVLFTGFGTRVNNATRWLEIPGIGIRFQPSEVAKWSVVFFLAGYLVKYRDRISKFWKGFVPTCFIVGIVVGLIVTQDLGTAAFISVITAFMLLLGGAKLWHFLTPLPAMVPAFIYVIINSPNRLARITAFLNPEDSSNVAIYHARQSLIAISTGGLSGKGLGRGICKWGHLPEDTTDFIFAIISEELGLFGSLVVIALFITFTIVGMLIVLRCKDDFGKLLSAGIVLAISIQAAINIGVVTVVLPTKGIPLPFISSGGTSLLVSSAVIGILINIARYNCKLEAQEFCR